MADGTDIEWARHPVTGQGATWNIVTGCRIVSPGCTNCYAMRLAGTRLRHHPSRAGLTSDSKAGPVWTGETRFNGQWLTQPLKWKTPRGIFVAAHGDLFAEGVTDTQLDQIFAVMALCPQHIFFVLTKRPERMRAYLRRPAGDGRQDVRNHLAWEILPQVMNSWAPGWKAEGIDGPHRSLGIHAFTAWPLPNVWLGVSVEDQPRADERIPILLDTPAAIRFISAEPLLGPVDLGDVPWPASWQKGTDDISDAVDALRMRNPIDWVIAGGESGPGARPSHPDWFRALRDQCAESGTAFFFKQWGEWTPGENVNRGGTLRCAEWFSDRWHFARQTEGQSQHTDREYEPDVYHVGKRAAGHRLDGVEHLAFPALGEGDRP